MNKKSLMAVLAAMLFLLGACGGDAGEETDTGSSGESGESADALPVTVTAKDFSFDTDSLEGHATHTVDLTFVNEDDAEHSFTIDEMEVDVEAAGGEEATTTFTPEEMGTFEFYCKYHPDTMKGEFEVS